MEQEQITKIKEKEFQVVVDPSETRQLVHKGYIIKDLKRNRYIKDASVHVFENTEKFRKDWEEIKSKKKKK